jgi:hypothetical protein
MSIILAISLFAQSIFPISGYLTSDQVDPERLVLATGAGRYQIALDTDPSSNCAQVGAGSSVVILGPVGIDLTM